jgi:hypothetical protein
MEFYIGLMGSFVGGFILAATTISLFMFEKRQANKRADQLMGELKHIYTQKLNQGIEQAFVKSNTDKFN